MKSVIRATLVLCLLALSWVVYAQSAIRAGRWEVTVQMEMANMPAKMPPIKATRCITAEEAADPSRSLPSGSPDATNDCKVSDYQAEGNKISWKVACTRPQTMAGTGELTVVNDTYDGAMRITADIGEMTMKLAGKRLGECTQ